MKPTVISFNHPLDPKLKERIEQHAELLDFTHTKTPADDPKFIEALATADGVIGSSLKFGAELIDKAPQLKVVSSVSAGVDNYDVEALNQRGILLCNTPDALTETVADAGFALILASARRVVELANWVRDGQWQKSLTPERFGKDVHHATLGIVGMGRIGAAIARRARFGFNMNVLYHNRSQHQGYEEEIGVEYRSFEELLKESDFVCTTLPYSEQTANMFNAEAFEMMGKETVFINIGRGGVVDEPALIAALENGTIKAAGLDVFAKEPLSADSPLAQLDNVVALPHLGSATEATRYAMAELAVDNLIAALSGERPQCPYNWKQIGNE
ncbi:2-hydroxyacid dehydrogenase [Carnimonas nigrificans]|uniref:2-hydroxyacid dehydrogenase n=1 Tax=Carnimonas nigrificans TaxID=64323 RepID=UPI00047221AF|nr:D-glycerate dehydrogenase [Carnimonas nigrificans]